MKGPKVKVRAEEPELPGAGAGATSLDPETVVGAPAAAPGDNAAAGESATTKWKKWKIMSITIARIQKFTEMKRLKSLSFNFKMGFYICSRSKVE